MRITIGIADDHISFLQSMSLLIESFAQMQISLQAVDGKDLLQKLSLSGDLPQVCLIDVNMPVLSGPETVKQLTHEFPGIRTIAMSMEEDDASLIKMLHNGCRGWWLKYQTPEELDSAIHEVLDHGYYNADPLNVYHRRLAKDSPQPPTVAQGQPEGPGLQLNEDELRLWQLSASDLSPDLIRDRMGLSEERLRSLQEQLYQKLHVRSRLGACLEAIRRNIT